MGRFTGRWGVGSGAQKCYKNHLFFNDFGDFEGSRSEVVLGGSWGASWGLSGGLSGPFWEPLGPLLGVSWVILFFFGLCCAPSVLFWAAFGPSWALLGLSWIFWGRFWVVMAPQVVLTPQEARFWVVMTP